MPQLRNFNLIKKKITEKPYAAKFSADNNNNLEVFFLGYYNILCLVELGFGLSLAKQKLSQMTNM